MNHAGSFGRPAGFVGASAPFDIFRAS